MVAARAPFAATLAAALLAALPATAQPAPGVPPQAAGQALPLAAADARELALASELLGRVVAAVELEVPAGERAVALAPLVDVVPGFPLDAGLVQATVERLYALGRFAQVEARVLPQGPSVVLRLVITPLLRLEEVRLRGLRGVDDDGLRQALRLQPGDEVDGQTEGQVQRRATAYLAQAGYPRAQVTVRRTSDASAGGVTLQVQVREKEPDRVASVAIGGTPRLPPAYLLPELQVQPGAVLAAAALERDRLATEARYHAHGFWRAEVKLLPPVYLPATPGAPRAARVRYEVAAHERLTFAFRGNRSVSDAELRALWPTRVGGPPRALLAQFAAHVRGHYGKESLPNAKVRVALRPAARRRALLPAMAACEVVVDVDEGAPVDVVGIHVEGVHSFPVEVLRRQVRAVLARELSAPSFFSPLGAAGALAGQAPSYGAGWAPHRLPPERRWVPELYARAAEDIAAAYRAAGFADVEVTVPPTLATAPTPPRAHAADAGAMGQLDAARRGDPDAWRPFVRLGTPPPPVPLPVTARLAVREGPQYFVERVTFSRNEHQPARELLQVVAQATGHYQLAAPLQPGNPLSVQGVEDARIALLRHYRDQGFFYARVFAEVAPLAGRAAAEVHFSLEEGPRVLVQHLLVRGNRHTREGVVRSRISLEPGGPYRLDRAVADQQEMMALGTFRRARVKLVDEEHPSGQKDVVAEVEERARQPVEVVPGLSTAAGPRLRLSYSHINVLGTASTFVAAAKVNRQLFFRLYGPYAETMRERFHGYRGLQQLTRALERELRLGLRSPPIKALPFDPLLRLDLVDQRLNVVRYGLNATTATLGVDARLTPRLRGSVEVQGGLTELECPLGNDCDRDRDVRRLRGGRPIQRGRGHVLKFGPVARYDHRDDPIAPSRGFLLQGRLSQAFGALRPDVVTEPFAFTKLEGAVTGYLPAFGAVLATSVRAGLLQLQRGSPPVDERFFLGGRDSLRGFVESTLIPQDACVVGDSAGPLPAHCVEGIEGGAQAPLSLGGNSFLLWKNELRLPLGAGMSFDVFVDVGNLWVAPFSAQGLHLRLGTGVGLRYATPVGAMTFDFGINPARRAINQEAAWQFHFSIGSF